MLPTRPPHGRRDHEDHCWVGTAVGPRGDCQPRWRGRERQRRHADAELDAAKGHGEILAMAGGAETLSAPTRESEPARSWPSGGV